MKDIYEDVIWKQIKQQVAASCLSVQDIVNNRKNTFEFYGYDFMVDDNLGVWLIEVNSSPSMETKDQPVLQRLVKAAMTELPKVIIDYAKAKKSNETVDTGDFQLVYKAKSEVQRPKGIGMDLRVDGHGIHRSLMPRAKYPFLPSVIQSAHLAPGKSFGGSPMQGGMAETADTEYSIQLPNNNGRSTVLQ